MSQLISELLATADGFGERAIVVIVDKETGEAKSVHAEKTEPEVVERALEEGLRMVRETPHRFQKAGFWTRGPTPGAPLA